MPKKKPESLRDILNDVKVRRPFSSPLASIKFKNLGRHYMVVNKEGYCGKGLDQSRLIYVPILSMGGKVAKVPMCGALGYRTVMSVERLCRTPEDAVKRWVYETANRIEAMREELTKAELRLKAGVDLGPTGEGVEEK